MCECVHVCRDVDEFVFVHNSSRGPPGECPLLGWVSVGAKRETKYSAGTTTERSSGGMFLSAEPEVSLTLGSLGTCLMKFFHRVFENLRKYALLQIKN